METEITVHVRYRETDTGGSASEYAFFSWLDACRADWVRSAPLLDKELRSGSMSMRTSKINFSLISDDYCDYDDLITIKGTADISSDGKISFSYVVEKHETGTPIANGYTEHTFYTNGRRISGKELERIVSTKDESRNEQI